MITFKSPLSRASAAAALALTTLFSTTACSPEVRSGTVVNKKFVPAHDETVQGSCIVYSKVGDSQICTAYNYYDDHIPDRWKITLENDKGDRSTHNVSKELYSDTKIGSEISLDGE